MFLKMFLPITRGSKWPGKFDLVFYGLMKWKAIKLTVDDMAFIEYYFKVTF